MNYLLDLFEFGYNGKLRLKPHVVAAPLYFDS